LLNQATFDEVVLNYSAVVLGLSIRRRPRSMHFLMILART